MKKALSLLLALVLCLSVSMCFAEADEGITIDIALGYSEPHSMDPTICTGADQYEILCHMYEGLLKYVPADTVSGTNHNEAGAALVPGQAASYTYDENTLTYTFTLRDDIFWSDGKPVTAQDFVYSWQRLVDPATAAANGSELNAIVLNATEIANGEMEPSELGITAIDDKTLEVKLANACSYFLELCAHYTLYPLRQDVIEAAGDTWTDPSTVISNGAYKMTEWVHDSYMALEKNDQYYDYANLGPAKLVFHLSDSETTNMAAYQSGDYDFVSCISADQIESLTASGDLFTNPRLNVTYLYMSMQNLPDWRVRAAILLAIDRENIVENVTQDGSTPASTLIPGGVTTSDSVSWTEAHPGSIFGWLQEQYPDYDLEDYGERCDLAVELYEAAVADGWDSSKTLDYQYNTSDTNKAVAEAVQADLDTVLGINVTLNNIDSAGYTATIYNGDFCLARLGYGISFNDAIGYYNLFGTNGSFEYSGYTNEEYDALVAQASTMPAGAERDEVLAQIENLMYTDSGFSICPLYNASYTYCMKSDLQGVYYTATGSLTIFSYASR